MIVSVRFLACFCVISSGVQPLIQCQTKLEFLGASVISKFVKLIEPSIDNCNLIQSMSLHPISGGALCLS